MVNIKTDATYHQSREFRTERIDAQKIKAGDMVYFEHDFLEVKMTQHFVTSKTEGANGDKVSLEDDTERTVRVRLLYDEDTFRGPGHRVEISEHKVGEKVILLRDTGDEAQMLLKTDAHAREAEQKYENLVAALAVMGDASHWDKMSDGKSDFVTKAIVSISDAVDTYMQERG